MSQLLSDLCRQLRLAYVSEAVEEKASPELCALITEVLKAEIEGRQRMKLNHLLHGQAFHKLKHWKVTPLRR
ncbi:hypothetical protein JCM39194_20060 [Desulfotomaculum varum]